ncbi:MAG: hypothetical protein KME50_38415 [Nostoc desertorum CM1-VF14]|nr:hypothetical protein [Nostoc desertorum CM1-VF14]
MTVWHGENTKRIGRSAGFFEQTDGSCQDDPIVIDFKGDFDIREKIVDGIY